MYSHYVKWQQYFSVYLPSILRGGAVGWLAAERAIDWYPALYEKNKKGLDIFYKMV
ncbi:MAG: hypothetical protein HFI03_14185 [Lachnospiraceae bacterium]|jgi:hypothetical protein|nr:hypothetical protein [Lachnospiraceae bacterium]